MNNSVSLAAMGTICLSRLVLPALGAQYSFPLPLLTLPDIWLLCCFQEGTRWCFPRRLKVALLKSEVCSTTHGCHQEPQKPSHLVTQGLSSGELSECMTLCFNSVLCHGKWCHRLHTIPPAYDSEWHLYPLWQTRLLWNGLTAGKTLGNTWWRESTTTTTSTWMLYLSHTEKDMQGLSDHRSSNIIHTSEVFRFQWVTNSTGYGPTEGKGGCWHISAFLSQVCFPVTTNTIQQAYVKLCQTGNISMLYLKIMLWLLEPLHSKYLHNVKESGEIPA